MPLAIPARLAASPNRNRGRLCGGSSCLSPRGQSQPRALNPHGVHNPDTPATNPRTTPAVNRVSFIAILPSLQQSNPCAFRLGTCSALKTHGPISITDRMIRFAAWAAILATKTRQRGAFASASVAVASAPAVIARDFSVSPRSADGPVAVWVDARLTLSTFADGAVARTSARAWTVLAIDAPGRNAMTAGRTLGGQFAQRHRSGGQSGEGSKTPVHQPADQFPAVDSSCQRFRPSLDPRV